MPQLIRPPGILSRARRPIEAWELPWVSKCWLANYGVTQADATERVSGWTDIIAGTSLAQGTAANQPILLPYSGANYLWLPGATANCATTPDSAALSITGDIDIRAEVALNDWTALNGFTAKYQTAGQQSYSFHTNGNLTFRVSADGTATKTAIASTTTGFAATTKHWVRVTYAVASGNVIFYTSEDGSNWTQLGTTQSVTAGAIFDGTTALTIGDVDSNGAWPVSGKFYRLQIYNGIGGTKVFDANFTAVSEGATSFTESSSNGATVTINRSGAKPAYIVGSPMLLGDGAAHFMQTGAITADAPYSLIEVAADTGWTGSDVTLDGRTANSFAFQQITASPQIRLHDGGANGATVSPTLYAWYVRSGVQAANGAASLGLNLAARTSDTLSATGLGGVTAWADGSGANFAAGFKKSIVLCNTALTSAQLTQTIQALARRCGVSV